MLRTCFRTGLLLLTALVTCMFLTAASAAVVRDVVCQAGTAGGGTVSLYPQTEQGETCLFLPAGADLHRLAFTLPQESAVLSGAGGTLTIQNGETFDLTALFPGGEQDSYPLTLTFGTRSMDLTVMQSESLPALFLSSASSKKDRAWVEQDKENKAKDGGIVLLRADGTTAYNGIMKNIKGRGNSTWDYPKKPYQLKLNEKADLLETGIPAEAESTWVLLANYCDRTLLHNSVSFDLADRLGLAYSPHFQQVDLYYDGEYRGTYLLCEKTEISKGRVAVANLEKAFEDANPDIDDFDALPTAYGANAYGNTFQYVSGLTSPEDLSGGYLLEIDYPDRAAEEKSWFSTSQHYSLTCKSPEYASRESMEYISGLYQQLENAIFNGGIDPETGKSYEELVDLDSLVRFYLITELSMDVDSFQSSCFFYKPAGEEKFYAGPVWDFDSGYGSAVTRFPVDAYVAGNTPIGRALLGIPSFRNALSTVLQNDFSGIVTDMTALFGSQPTLSSYGEEVAASQRMNAVLWPEVSPADYAAEVDSFRDLLNRRLQWMRSMMENWEGSPADSIGFLDVPASEWFYDAVLYATQKGLFSGTSNSTFSPNDSMTRAMAVTVLYRMSGETAANPLAPVFRDVAPALWYSNAVAWAAEKGITTGYADGAFRPDQRVTRQEFAAFLYRYAGSPAVRTVSLPYPDAAAVESYAAAPLCWAVNRGLMKGDNYGKLLPTANITRAQAATLLQRYLESKASPSDTILP